MPAEFLAEPGIVAELDRESHPRGQQRNEFLQRAPRARRKIGRQLYQNRPQLLFQTARALAKPFNSHRTVAQSLKMSYLPRHLQRIDKTLRRAPAPGVDRGLGRNRIKGRINLDRVEDPRI